MSTTAVEERVEAILKVLPIQGSAVETARRFVLAVAKISPELLPEPLRHPLAAQIDRGVAALPELIAIVDERHEIEKSFALEAIGRIAQAGSISDAALAVLERYAGSDRTALAGPARVALAMARDAKTVERAKAMLLSPDVDAQLTAVRLLAYGRDPAVLPHLLVALRPDRPLLARAIVRAFGEIGDPQVVVTLIAMLEDRFMTVDVLEALGELGRFDAFPAVLAFVTSQARDERVAATKALARIIRRDRSRISDALAEQARPILLKVIDNDESRLARYYAFVAYAALGGEIAPNRVMTALGAGLATQALDPMAAFFARPSAKKS